MSDFDGIDFTNVESREEESSSYIPKGDYNCISANALNTCQLLVMKVSS